VSKRLSFFPLRDASGTTQLALHAAADGALATLSASPVESAVLVEGEVRLRPEGQRRPVRPPLLSPLSGVHPRAQEAAGSIEVLVDAATLLNAAAQPLPFYASDASVLVSCLLLPAPRGPD
jgi:aspartyl-tRNA synthetase